MLRRRRIARIVVVAVVAVTLGLVAPPPASTSCVGPVLGVGSAVDDANPPTSGGLLRRGQPVTVTGEWFHSGCADTYAAGPGCSGSPVQAEDPEAPLTDVQLTLHQRSRSWVLGTADATGEHYSISWSWRLPSDAEPGPAELRAGSATLPVTIGP